MEARSDLHYGLLIGLRRAHPVEKRKSQGDKYYRYRYLLIVLESDFLEKIINRRTMEY